jgi:carboxylate-amine ligase
MGVSRAIPAVRFGVAREFALGIEEELIMVDPRTHALVHTGIEVLDRLRVAPEDGSAHPDTYAAMIELATPVVPDAAAGAAALDALRARMRATGATAVGAGIHPEGAFGDVVHAPGERYRTLAEQVRGLVRRTPTAAVHVHVSMPDAETAIRVCNGLREHLPLLQALAANSPFWHGQDSGLASARAQLFRGFPRSDIPRAFASFDDYAETVEAVVAAGALPDYTFVWWDVRPHPALGTVEVRAMDAQARLWTVAGLAALVQALAHLEAERGHGGAPREALMEASFVAARDGLDAVLWAPDGGAVPAREAARAAVELARPHARDLGSEDALDELLRLLREGNGADRQRAAYARGGMGALLDLLVAETRAPYAYTSTRSP